MGPYTKAAEDFVIDIPQGSTAGVIIPTVKKEVLPTTPEGPEGEALGRTKSFRSLVNQVKNSRASVKHRPRKPVTEEGDEPVEMWSGYLGRDKKVGGKSKISVDTAKKAEPAKVATPPPPKPAAPTPAPEAPKEKADITAKAAVAGKGGGDIPPIDDVPIEEEKPVPVKKPLVKEPSEESLGDWEREEEDLRDMSAW